MRDIYINHEGNGNSLHFSSPINVETTFEWLQANFQRIRFCNRFSAQLFVDECNKGLRSQKFVKKKDQLHWSCSFSSLCPFSITVRKESANSRYYCVQKFVCHDHSVNTVPEGRLTPSQEKLLECEREKEEATQQLEEYRRAYEATANANSRKKLKQKIANLRRKINGLEQKIRELGQATPDDNDFSNRYGFDGYNSNNEKHYVEAINNLSILSQQAIDKHEKRVNNHKDIIRAAQEYNAEMDEGACRSNPSPARRSLFLQLKVSLNSPLTMSSRRSLADALINGSIIGEEGSSEEEDIDEERSEEEREEIPAVRGRRRSRVDVDVSDSNDTSIHEDDNDESFSINNTSVYTDDNVMSDVAVEIPVVLRHNPIDIEKLDRDFDKNVKVDCTKLVNALVHLYFVKYPQDRRFYSSISREPLDELFEHASKRARSTNDLYDVFGELLSKQTFRRIRAKLNNENLNKSYCIYYLNRMSIHISQY